MTGDSLSLDLGAFVSRIDRYSWIRGAGSKPWEITSRAADIIGQAVLGVSGEFQVSGGVAIHRTATVELGAVVKGPAFIGPRCFIATSAYLRAGVFLEEDCVIGPGAELKSALIFKGAALAHFNFVGDSILGEATNLEAGSIIANYRNELDDKRIRIATPTGVIAAELEKFGALVGDRSRIGANAVIAPGTLLAPGTVVPRLHLIDQRPS